jgi:hypothetical protein
MDGEKKEAERTVVVVVVVGALKQKPEVVSAAVGRGEWKKQPHRL